MERPQADRPLEEKPRFYDKLAGEYELQNPGEWYSDWEILMDMLVKR